MENTITTLDNSKYKKDYNKFFTIGDDYRNHEIGNTELSDKMFLKVFEIVNTIIVISPDEDRKIDSSLSHKIGEEFKYYNSQIKELFRIEKLKIHSKDYHPNNGKNSNCDAGVHFFKFDDYSEVVKFLDWEELDEGCSLKAYTTLICEKEDKPLQMTVNNNIDNSKHIDKSTTNNINSKGGVISKVEVGTTNKKSKSWWEKLLSLLKSQ